jgi:hypothetical protein
VCEVQASTSGHEKFSRGRRHAFENGDAETLLAKDFRGNEACGARPYNDDMFQEDERFLFELAARLTTVLLRCVIVEGSVFAEG